MRLRTCAILLAWVLPPWAFGQEQTIEDLPSRDSNALELLEGWAADVPLSEKIVSVTFEHFYHGVWIEIKSIESEFKDRLRIHFTPGINAEREIIYAIPGYRGAYVLPEQDEGALQWEGVKPMEPGSFQLLAHDGEACVRVRLNRAPSFDISQPSPMVSKLGHVTDAAVLEQKEVLIDPKVNHFFSDASALGRATLVVPGATHSPLLIEDIIVRDNTGVRQDIVVRSNASVADNVVVKLVRGVSRRRLVTFLRENDMEIREKAPHPTDFVVGFSATSVTSLDEKIELLRSHPSIFEFVFRNGYSWIEGPPIDFDFDGATSTQER